MTSLEPNKQPIHILHPSLSQECMQIESYLTIDDPCITRAFVHNTQIPLSISKLVYVRQVFQLIEKVSKYYSDSVDLAVRSATTHLSRLTFIHCQLENVLVPKTRRKYNVLTTLLSLKCELISPAAYRYLQSLDCISLPHHSTLHRFSKNIGLENDFISHLKQSTFLFNQQQRPVSLHMDEIHLKSEHSYKGGKIIGSSNSPNKLAKTIMDLWFFTKWSSVVRILPCSETSASEIFPITKKVICDIEPCNLFVVTIITDNYPLNVRLFKFFSPTSKLEHSVPHPVDSNRPIFFLFDFVHILRTIRNN